MSGTRSRSTPSRATLALLVVALLAGVYVVYHVAAILGLLFVSILFALYLGGLTTFLDEKLRIGRGWGLIASLLITAAGMTGIGWLIVPPVLQQTGGLLRTMPSTVAGISSYLLDLGAQYPILRGILPDAAAVEAQFAAIQRNLGDYFTDLVPYVFTGVGALIHLISVIVMAVYLTVTPDLYTRGFVRLFPPRRRPLVSSILEDLAVTLRGWIGAQMVAMVILAGLTWVGLVILGVPFALAFGVFTGMAVMVPFFGTLVSTALPALFVMGTGGMVQALLVLLLGVIVHLFEANFVHPMIMHRRIKIPPVLSIFAVLVMAELFGALGLLLAVPVVATLLVLIRRAYIEEVLERPRRAPPQLAAHTTETPDVVLHAS